MKGRGVETDCHGPSMLQGTAGQQEKNSGLNVTLGLICAIGSSVSAQVKIQQEMAMLLHWARELLRVFTLLRQHVPLKDDPGDRGDRASGQGRRERPWTPWRRTGGHGGRGDRTSGC